MSSVSRPPFVVESDAEKFVFRAGQLVECMLVDRAIELARKSGSSVVTVEDVESCLDQMLLDDLLKRMKEGVHGGITGTGRANNEKSREAA